MIVKDKIIDFAGKEHWFIIASHKETIKDSSKDPAFVDLTNSDGDIYDIGFVGVGLSIGISICNPLDEFDEAIGIKKAQGRADNSEPVLFANFPSQLGDSVIESYLLQEAEYIKANPHKFIAGYKDAEIKYFEEKEIEKIQKEFSDLEKTIVKEIEKDPTFLDRIKRYFKCKK